MTTKRKLFMVAIGVIVRAAHFHAMIVVSIFFFLTETGLHVWHMDPVDVVMGILHAPTVIST
jgi:hypothetical protein